MKAVLVVDMPETCLQCPFTPICGFDSRNAVRIIRGEGTSGRLSECPLKPLPTEFKTYKLSPRDQEETELFINMAMLKVYADGYNACLKEIEDD